MRVSTIALIAALTAAPALAQDGGVSHDGHMMDQGQMDHGQMDHGAMDHGAHAGMMEGVHAKAEIHSIDGDTVNLTHEPIPEIGWPGMTMDMKLLEGAEVDDVKPGDKVVIMLEQDAEGIYGLRAIEKAE